MTFSSDPVTLDVFLRGTRSYVQGTQVIARVARLLTQPNAHFVSASFKSITENLVSTLPITNESKAPSETPPPLGTVIFQTSGEDQVFHCFDTGTPAPRHDRSMNLTLNLADKRSTFSARYEFRGLESFEDLLNVVVQSVKAMHAEIDEQVRDIWFTGIRGFTIPTSLDKKEDYRFIDCVIVRMQRAAEQYQTLVKIRILDSLECQIHSGVVTFAFKSDGALNVN